VLKKTGTKYTPKKKKKAILINKMEVLTNKRQSTLRLHLTKEKSSTFSKEQKVKFENVMTAGGGGRGVRLR
jgi:hypothetical protein